jgi:hypothetical protein
MKHTLFSILLLLTATRALSQDCIEIRRCVNSGFDLDAPFTADSYEWMSGSSLDSLTVIADEMESTYEANLHEYSITYFKVRSPEDSICWMVSPVVITISGDLSVCEGDTIALAAEISNCSACTFAWSGLGLIAPSNLPDASYSFENASDSPVNITVNATFTDGEFECPSTVTSLLTVNTTPVFSLNNNFCVGDSIKPIGLQNNSNDYLYSWNFNDIDSDSDFFQIIEPASGTISLTVTENTSNCHFQLQQSITINPLPPFELTTNDACLNQTVESIISSNSSISTYSWDEAPPGNNASYFPASTSEGTYSVNVQITDANGCHNYGTDSYTIFPLPNVSIIGNSSSICVGDNITLSSMDVYESYLWNIEENPNSINTDELSTTFEQSGNYVITLTATDNQGCSNSDTTLISVNAIPSATISGPEEICIGFPYSYQVLSNNIISTITWNNSSTVDTLVFIPETLGNNTISVEIEDDNGCVGSDEYEVSVFSLPIVTIEGSTLICGRTEFELTAIPGDNTYSFEWVSGDSLISNNNSVTIDGGYGQFGISLITTNAVGCSSETLVEISAITGPLSPLDNEINICEGNVLELAGSNDYQYQWIIANNNTPFDTTTANNPTFNLEVGTYQVYLTLTDTTQDGCLTLDTALVYVKSNPIFTVNTPEISCIGVPFEFAISQVTIDGDLTENYSVTWTNQGLESMGNPYIDTTLNAGAYTLNVEVEDSLTTCSSAQELVITFNTGPSFTHTIPTPDCLGAIVQLEIDTVFASEYNINWFISDESINANSTNFTLSDSANTYSVSVTNSENGCISDSIYTVESLALPEILNISLLTDGLLAINPEAGYFYEWGYTSAATGIEITIVTGTDYAYFDYFDLANNYYWVQYTNSNGCVRRVYYNTPITFTGEQYDEQIFLAYPIPSENTLTIQSKLLPSIAKSAYSIFNSQGQIVEFGELSRTDNKTILNVSNLSQGQYYIQIQSEENIYTLRFIK